eukprot:g2744.t1
MRIFLKLRAPLSTNDGTSTLEKSSSTNAFRKLALRIPSSWESDDFKIESFLAYARKTAVSKFPDAEIPENCFLKRIRVDVGEHYLSEVAVFNKVICNKDEVELGYGNLPEDETPITGEEQLNTANDDANSASPANEDDELIFCTNFGCGKKFRKGDNHDKICRHHRLPPVFHETHKWFACCPHKKGYDWDSFMAIQGCVVGPHSSKKVKKNVLGGRDLMSDEDYEYMPKMMQSGSKDAKKQSKKKKSAYDDFGEFKKMLVKYGVDGKIFEDAKVKFQKEHTEKGLEYDFDKMFNEIGKSFGKVINEALKQEVSDV